MANTAGDVGQSITHDHHVGSLHRGIGADCTHGSSDIGTGKHRCIVYSITNKEQRFFPAFLLHHPFDMLNFILGQQFAMIFIHTDLCGNRSHHRSFVTTEHDDTLYSK